MMFRDIVQNKSVALVGNALSLYDYQFGKEIDDHDIVIRLNIPGNIVYKDENDLISTGNKIDIWCFWNSRIFVEKVLDREDCDVRLIYQYHNFSVYKAEVTYGNNNIECLYDNDILLDNLNKEINEFLFLEKYKKKIDQRHMIYMLRYNHLKGIKSKKHNISTGTLVLSYLLKYCHLKSLSIYGMDFKRTPTFYDISSHEENMKNTRIDHLCRHNYGNEEKYSLHMISKRKNVKIRGMLEDERMV